MPKLFIHISLQRCGCHAITNWLMKQRHEEVYPYKVIGPGTFLYETSSDKSIYFFNACKIDKSLTEHRGHDNTAKALEGHDIVVGFEDGNLKHYDEDRLFSGLDVSNHEIIRIISLRDCWNCFASFYKKYNEVPIHIQRLWEERAEEVLAQTNYLNEYFLFVSYNEWFKSKNYRENVAMSLDLSFTDRGMNDVPKFGDGSSFTKTDMHGKGSKMPVLSRYREFENNNRFLKYVTPYKQQLSKRIFSYNDRPDEH